MAIPGMPRCRQRDGHLRLSCSARKAPKHCRSYPLTLSSTMSAHRISTQYCSNVGRSDVSHLSGPSLMRHRSTPTRNWATTCRTTTAAAVARFHASLLVPQTCDRFRSSFGRKGQNWAEVLQEAPPVFGAQPWTPPLYVAQTIEGPTTDHYYFMCDSCISYDHGGPRRR